MKKFKMFNIELFFYIGFLVYLIGNFFATTNFVDVMGTRTFQVIRYLGISLAFFKIILDRYKKNTFAILLLVILLITICIKINSYTFILFLLIFLISAKNTDLNKTNKIYFYTKLILLLITMIAAQCGFIRNTVTHADNNMLRNSFGVVYATDFASHVLFLMLSYIYMKKEKLCFRDLVVALFIQIFIYKYCVAKLDTLIISMLIIFCCIVKYKKNFIDNKLIKFFVNYSFLILGLLTIILTILYGNGSKFILNLNDFLSNRLYYGYAAIKTNGISLYGNYIKMYGTGSGELYNYIDSSYIRFIVLYGVVCSSLILMLNIFQFKKAFNAKNIYLIIILFIINIHSMIEQHYLDFSFNYFTIIALSNINLKVKGDIHGKI